jgi:hypothetical protein
MSNLNRDTLLNVGFLDVGRWELSGEEITYTLDGDRIAANEVLLDDPNALYAFVQGDAVRYIGKTTRGVRRRFITYRRPGKRQLTNLRCNAKIKEALNSSAEIRILVFAPISHLRYLDFEINLAAGLEDALIKAFGPPWNGRERDKPITEETEREKAEENTTVGATEAEASMDRRAYGPPLASFKIRLGHAYFEQGIVNPGVNASHYLGDDGEHLQVLFDDGSDPVLSRINRRANPSGGVRVVGRNRQIAEWFQRHFAMGDVVEARVIDANRILLLAPKPEAGPPGARQNARD